MTNSVQALQERTRSEDSTPLKIEPLTAPSPLSTSTSLGRRRTPLWLRRLRLWARPWPNPSGLEPVGHAVLLVAYQPEFEAAQRAGLAIPDEEFRLAGMMVEMRAQVLALGPDAWRNDQDTWLRRLLTPWRPRALPGDKVMVSKMAGAVVHGTADGKLYRMVNDQDVFVKIVDEAEKPVYPH